MHTHTYIYKHTSIYGYIQLYISEINDSNDTRDVREELEIFCKYLHYL